MLSNRNKTLKHKPARPIRVISEALRENVRM